MPTSATTPSNSIFRGPFLGALPWLAGYVLVGALTVVLPRGIGPSLWYPPIAVGLACLVLRGSRAWPVVFAGDLAVSWWSYGSNGAQAVFVAANTTLACVLAARMLRSLGFDPALRRLTDVVLAALAAAFGATLVGASTGSLLPRVLPGMPPATLESWLTWWMGDAVGVITVMPAILLAFGPRAEREAQAAPGGALERAVLLTVTVLAGLRHAVAGSSLVRELAEGWMFSALPIAWAAVRFDRRTTTWTIVLLGLASMVGLRLHPGPPATGPAGLWPEMLVAQGNLAFGSVLGLMFSRWMARERALRRESARLLADLELRDVHLRMAQRVGQAGSWELDAETGARRWSDTLFDVFDFDPADGVPDLSRIERRVHPDSVEEFQRMRAAAYEGRDHPAVVVRMTMPRRGERWISIRSEQVTKEGRTVVVGLCVDVTEIVRRDELTTKLATIVSSSPDAILTVLADGTLVTWNTTATRLFGLDAAEPAGTYHWEDLILDERRPAARAELERAFRGERVRVEQAELMRADDSRISVRLGYSPIRDAHRSVAEVAIQCTDRSEQRVLEQQLLQAQKMEAVGRLTGSIAHDFNNMLTAIQGFSELVRARVSNDPVATRDCDQVVLAAERAGALTQRLLAFSRREAGRPRVIELDAMLERLLPTLQRLLGESIRLEFVGGAGHACLSMDPTQIEQVLLNLLVNSRDAMPEGGRVTVRTWRSDRPEDRAYVPAASRVTPLLVFEVADEGSGMPAATLDRVFEPFFTTKDAGRGTGLGLSTVQSIVRENGGGIRVTSEPGHGTAFQILFAEQDAATVSVESPRVVSESPRGTESVLVVEDEPLVRKFLVTCLEGSGYRVRAAASIAQAETMGAESGEPIDLLVTDLVLPDGDGLALAGRFAARRPGPRVLLLSGYHEMPGRGALPGELLAKPVTRAALLAAVRRALAKSAGAAD